MNIKRRDQDENINKRDYEMELTYFIKKRKDQVAKVDGLQGRQE